MELEFSPKQLEFITNCTHRWNGKIGATQCGKTYIDVCYVIPELLRERRGLNGLNVILGVSKGTIERNVLEPMRDIWGSQLVGTINNENIAILFGQKVYCLGAEKVNQVSKLRGAKIKFAYWDEMVDCNEEVFELLKSRLSLPYSICVFTGNPSNPNHFVKQFIDSEADVYCQNWTLFDNPFLSDVYVNELCKEYSGSVYYNRYILGEWKHAEGVIYRKFADNPEAFILDNVPPLMCVEVGIDFGGNKSANTFVASGFTRGYRDWIVLENERITEEVNPDELYKRFVTFANKIYNKYMKAFTSNYDNAEPVLARGMEVACLRAGCRTSLEPAIKMSVNNRIHLITRLMGAGRFWVMRECKHVIKALQEAIWNSARPDTRLDDGTSDIDTLDALEYSGEKHFAELMEAINSSAVKKEVKKV